MIEYFKKYLFCDNNSCNLLIRHKTRTKQLQDNILNNDSDKNSSSDFHQVDDYYNEQLYNQSMMDVIHHTFAHSKRIISGIRNINDNINKQKDVSENTQKRDKQNDNKNDDDDDIR